MAICFVVYFLPWSLFVSVNQMVAAAAVFNLLLLPIVVVVVSFS